MDFGGLGWVLFLLKRTFSNDKYEPGPGFRFGGIYVFLFAFEVNKDLNSFFEDFKELHFSNS